MQKSFSLLQKYLPMLFLAAMPLLAGCSVIGGILKFGFFAGIIMILIIIGLIWWIMKLFRGRS